MRRRAFEVVALHSPHVAELRVSGALVTLHLGLELVQALVYSLSLVAHLVRLSLDFVLLSSDFHQLARGRVEGALELS